jgi:hypothetical protein
VGFGVSLYMREPRFILTNGTKILTHAKLDPITGFSISSKHIDLRKPETSGEIYGVVAGHGGDVYWVRHEGDVYPAAYCYSEFELVAEATTVVDPC